MSKKWNELSHEERIESFAKYIKFEISKYIKEGIKVWENQDNQQTMPFNAITGKHYAGMNSILLESEAKKRGFENGAWINLQQAKSAGIEIKEDELKNGVKIAYIKQFETRIKKDENGKPITEPQLDKEGNVKINPKTGEPYWRYVTEKIKLDKPILETSYLFHQSQCKNLNKITSPTIANNPIEVKAPIISKKIELFPQTKKDICNYLETQQIDFLKSQGVDFVRNLNEQGKVISEGLFIDGKMNGMQKTYHDNGMLKSIVNCVDDKYNGIKKEYFDNGKLRSETQFEMDKKGIYKEFDENGKVVKEIDFKKEGQEVKQEQKKTQKRVSPQVRAEQEKKIKGRGR